MLWFKCDFLSLRVAQSVFSIAPDKTLFINIFLVHLYKAQEEESCHPSIGVSVFVTVFWLKFHLIMN